MQLLRPDDDIAVDVALSVALVEPYNRAVIFTGI